MSLNGLGVENWEEAASASFHSRRLILSASVLFIYDMVLTMDCEMKIMWQRRFRVADVVYFTNRYDQLWNVLLNLALFAYYDSQRYDGCRTLGVLAQIATMVPNISWAAFSGLRTYAMSNGNLLLGWFIFGMSATFIIPNIHSLEGLQGFSLPSPINCVSRYSPASMTTIIVSRTVFLISEIIVMFLTWRNTMMDRRLIRRLPPKTPSLQRVLLANGVMCFTISFMLNALMFASDVVGGWTGTRTMEGFQQIVDIVGPLRNSISSILLSRFLLELEKVCDNCNTPLDSGAEVMTTQIAYHPSDVPSVMSTSLDHA